MPGVSVVIPVKDGARFLREVLDAVVSQDPDEVLVIDSGSRDESVEIAAAHSVELLRIAPEEFGHGRTRNLGAKRTSGELICFLTQDAVPVDGWLAAYREAFDLGERVGAAFGPHLPLSDTSPMIARELTEFFAAFGTNGRPRVVGPEEPLFLSNVNACYRRECLEELPFPDVAYSEDQALARAMPAANWSRVYAPDAAVAHAHDFGVTGFARRYFDEYRGLRATTGHVEPVHVAEGLQQVGAHVTRDVRWMRDRGWPARRTATWIPRSVAHHASRRVFSALGSRAERLPEAVQRRLSLEGTTAAGAPAPAEQLGAPRGPAAHAVPWHDVLEVSRDGVAPLAEPAPGMSDKRRLHVAVVVPPFRRGSGGHNTIFQLTRRLEDMGHTCSIWIHDALHGDHIGRAAVSRREIVDWFAPVRAPVFAGFEAWHGADVAVATGWDTVHGVARLPDSRARVYLVNDHEPEFFATSAEALFAANTYELGFFPISASPWLRDLLAERYGASGTAFRLGVDHGTYRPLPVQRRRDTVLFYARASTPRRAVSLGALALEALKGRRPDTRVVTFGEPEALDASFEHYELGVASPGQLAQAYSEGTVGLCLSLTNYSLIPQEMMACGLPCVDIAGGSSEATFGADGPVELAQADPVALAEAMERLLDDEERWLRRSRQGLAFVADASWDTAAQEVESGLREALRERERSLS